MTNTRGVQVIFGTGPVGLAVGRLLLARGYHVRLVNRRRQADVPPGAEIVQGDATDPASVRRACQDAAVVYHCASAPYAEWPTRFPPITDGIIEGAAAAGAKLVYADNLYMYGPAAGALTEDLPYAATGPKGRTRAEMATAVLQAHESGKIRATIGRASNIYGPGVRDSAVGERVFRAALTGKAAEALGNIDTPHTYTYVEDFAHGLVTLGERDEALGRAWHVPSAPTLSTKEFLSLIFEEAGTTPKFRVAPRLIVTLIGLFNPMMRELKETLYQFEQPFVVDHSAFARTFGGHPTPHQEAIRDTLSWCREAQPTHVPPTAGVA